MDWYDKKGKKLSNVEATPLLMDEEYKIIEQTRGKDKDGEELLVSTVWLGLDHNYDGGKPLIFETMVFPKGEWLERYCERYSTEAQAKKGHKKAVKQFLAEIDK